MIDRWRADHAHAAPRALILGTTPELHTLAWHGNPSVVPQTAWRKLPLPAASIDIAVCDGGLQRLSHPDGQREMLESLHGVLATDGLAVFRLFAPSPVAETPADVFRALLDGRIPDPARLRLRLWSALQRSPREGVSPSEAWQTLRDLAGSEHEALAGQLEADRDCRSHHYLITPGEAVQLFAAAGFQRQSTLVPTYALGRQCQTMVFGRR
jgi:SAM-dependent methyltransferase